MGTVIRFFLYFKIAQIKFRYEAFVYNPGLSTVDSVCAIHSKAGIAWQTLDGNYRQAIGRNCRCCHFSERW
jgi:hypothetical protein